ncbi:MAG: ArnT family glycosyltransferase, partial [Eubacterium sp.]
MQSFNSIKKRNKTAVPKRDLYIFWASLLVHIALFIINLFVGGYHIDEIMTVLNARSIADNAQSITGAQMPFYFDTWIYGGQSPFATYLTALSVKLLSYSMLSVRLPALVFGMVSLLAFYGLLREIIKDERYISVIFLFTAFSPWHLFSSAYLLDCNYFAHTVIIAVYFLARSVKTKKNVYFIVSMAFFSLGFYSYMASVFFIPIMLAFTYIYFLATRTVNIKQTAVSVISLFVLSLPFILFGLVNIGAVNGFELLGFSFYKMPEYDRSGSMAFMNSQGVFSAVLNCFKQLFSSLDMLFFEGLMSIIAVGLNKFGYTSLLGGMFIAFEITDILLKKMKNRRKMNKTAAGLAFGITAGVLMFCCMLQNPRVAVAYRYSLMTYFFVIPMGAGFVKMCMVIKRILTKLKKKALPLKSVLIKATAVYMCIAGLIFCFNFYSYSNQIYTEDTIYGDSLVKSLDFAKEINPQKIVILNSNDEIKRYEYNGKMTVYLRWYY